MENLKKPKVICPTCRGNGYIKVPFELTREYVTAQCTVCHSQGEIDEDKIKDIVIDSDGFHSLQ